MTSIVIVAISAFVIGGNVGFLLGGIWHAHCAVQDRRCEHHKTERPQA